MEFLRFLRSYINDKEGLLIENFNIQIDKIINDNQNYQVHSFQKLDIYKSISDLVCESSQFFCNFQIYLIIITFIKITNFYYSNNKDNKFSTKCKYYFYILDIIFGFVIENFLIDDYY